MAPQIDYAKVDATIGLVVSDGREQYIVTDYILSMDVYQLWAKADHCFYYTSYHALHALYDVISG